MAAVVPNPINESTVGKENDVLGHPHVRNKNNIPRICEMQNGEEHTKKNSHDTKFTWFTTWATSTELQRSFTIK
jgi:hypothetical protein